MKTKILAIAAAVVVLVAGAGLLAVSAVKAAEESGDYPLIIQNLAEKFGLNADEVEQVFEDTKKERMSNRLDELVEDGTITEDQKNLIIEKQEEMQSKMEEINNQQLTAQERREAMQELREEMTSWAEENDIPQRLVMMGGGRGPRGGMHGFGGGPCGEEEGE